MESVPKRKRMKNYLEKGEPFIIPSSTKCRNRTERGCCLEGSIAPGGEASPSPLTSGYGQPTLYISDDPAEELSDQLETDACFDESLDEWSNMETELDHGDPCQQDDIINEEHDVPDTPCLADSFAEYGNSTPPHSTTTKAEAVALIMSFLASENLTWSALYKLLHMVNAMFGVVTAYKHLQQTGVLEWTDLTTTFNTDGSPLYKSSRSCVRPIQLIINELPPTVRINHCALAGLWFGSTHPDMGLFMTNFVEEVTSLDTVTWKNDSTVMTSKVHALCCCVDAPARAEVRNHTHFNGYLGAPGAWLVERTWGGSLLLRSLRHRGAVPDEERTPEGVLRDMKLALQSGVSLNGVKGSSPIATLPNFNLVWGFNVNYMHCVLLGFARHFMEYLLNSTNCHDDF
ncbi:hypothetical protein HPB47_015411 [Ixodes persulcatus]|uniref:Uncharacterized protein n=1 Tax=Ixodes persulcatus TaxID=34615 RepID=A0AC60QW57_IXOPE|nr:hypothetical protein HPB47_015411 [Ixodes persulcatus]